MLNLPREWYRLNSFFSLAGLTDGHYFQVKFNEAVNKVVHAKDKVIDELRKKEKEMEEEINANKGW